MTLATGEDGDVLEHGLATVAEPGGLDRDGLEGAPDLVDHERSQGFASRSSATIRSGLPDCMTFSSTGRRSFTAEIFELTRRICGSSRTASMRSGSEMK
jgi:hypothetical protein